MSHERSTHLKVHACNVTVTLWLCSSEQHDVLVMYGANAYAPDRHGYEITVLYSQVPTALWADQYHFTREGLQVFADAFAGSLVGHLREQGMAVEGFGLRYRACACGARAVAWGGGLLSVVSVTWCVGPL